MKAENYVSGPEGYFPSALVFREYPNALPESKYALLPSTGQKRGKLAKAARESMERIMAELKLREAISHSVLSASNHKYSEGHDDQVWREKLISTRTGQFLGPFEVTKFAAEKKMVHIMRNGTLKPLGITKIKAYSQDQPFPRTLLHNVASPSTK